MMEVLLHYSVNRKKRTLRENAISAIIIIMLSTVPHLNKSISITVMLYRANGGRRNIMTGLFGL
jgi:hypothetical protein